LSQCKCVFDTIYNPFETKLQKIAKSQGAKVISGLYMLVCQAALSQNIWTGAEFTKDQLKQLYEDTKKEQAKLFPCKIGL
jgi:shikimate dehydrogenase